MTPATAGTGGIRCLASHCAWRARRTRAACWRSTRLMWSIPPPAGNTRRRLWRNFPDGCGSIWTRAFPGCLRRRTARYWAMPTPVASPHAWATTGTPRSQYTCLPPHTGGTPPPRCTPHCWLCCAGRATSTALRSSHTPTRPAPPSTSGWALPKPRACPTRATRTAGGWVFPIISSRCSRFLPCPCRLCR